MPANWSRSYSSRIVRIVERLKDLDKHVGGAVGVAGHQVRRAEPNATSVPSAEIRRCLADLRRPGRARRHLPSTKGAGGRPLGSQTELGGPTGPAGQIRA